MDSEQVNIIYGSCGQCQGEFKVVEAWGAIVSDLDLTGECPTCGTDLDLELPLPGADH